MTLTRKDRDQHPSIDTPHQTGGQLSLQKLKRLTRNEPSGGCGGHENHIHSWQLRVAATQNSFEFDASSPRDKDHDKNESHWHPNNLPVSRELPNRDSRRRTRYFVDDKTITISSTTSSISHDSNLRVSRNDHGGENPKRRRPPSHDSRCSSPDELVGAKKSRRKTKPSQETNNSNNQAEEHHRSREPKTRPQNGHDREKPKRRRSPSHDSQCSSSDELVFTKKPRHKTKPDRYETKKRNNQAKESKSKKPKAQPRKKKDELRSYRDVVDNFASGAISDKRLTVVPDLTAGLLSNSRSSASKHKLTDLAFNDMSFLKDRENITHRERYSTDPPNSNDRGSSQDINPTKTRLGGSRGRTQNRRAAHASSTRAESSLFVAQTTSDHQSGERSQSRSGRDTEKKDTVEQSEVQQLGGGTEERRQSSISQNESTGESIAQNAPSRSQTPVSIGRALAATGVYDYTELSGDRKRDKPADEQTQDDIAMRGMRERLARIAESHDLSHNCGRVRVPTVGRVQSDPLRTLSRGDGRRVGEDTNNAQPGEEKAFISCRRSLPPVPLYESTWDAAAAHDTRGFPMEQLEVQVESTGYADAFDSAANESRARVDAKSRAFGTSVQNDVYHHAEFSNDYQLLHGYQPTDTIDLGATSTSRVRRSAFQVPDSAMMYQGRGKTNNEQHSNDTRTETMKEFIDRIEAEVGYEPETKQDLDQDSVHKSLYNKDLGTEMLGEHGQDVADGGGELDDYFSWEPSWF